MKKPFKKEKKIELIVTLPSNNSIFDNKSVNTKKEEFIYEHVANQIETDVAFKYHLEEQFGKSLKDIKVYWLDGDFKTKLKTVCAAQSLTTKLLLMEKDFFVQQETVSKVKIQHMK